MRKHLLTWLLILAMVTALFPFSALGADAPGLSDAFVDPLTEWDQYDALIEAARTERDMAKRAALLHQAEDMLMGTGCIVPLYYYGGRYLMKASVQDAVADPTGMRLFTYASKTTGETTLRVWLAGEPYSVDPAMISSTDGFSLAAAAFSGLFGYDAAGRIVPACADHYTVSDDGLTYTVTLKDGLKWSDGSALTAGDFAFAWKRAAAEETGADYGYLYENFAGYPNIQVQATDAQTLQFVLAAPCSYIEAMLAFPTFYPVKQSVVEANPEGWCAEAGFVSNGPFTLTEWSHNTSMTFTKNPNWYDAANVKLQSLVYSLEEDPDVVLQQYDSGTIDFMDTVEDSAAVSHESELHNANLLGDYYVTFHAGSPIFAGKTPEQAACMRQAMSMLIDRNAIVMQSSGQTPANTFIPRGMADGNGGIFHESESDGYYEACAIANDPAAALAKARELLEYAGFTFGADGKLSDATPLTVRYVMNDSPGHAAIAEQIRSSFAALGIDLDTTAMNWSDYAHCDFSAYDLARGGWIADFNDPFEMLALWKTDALTNRCGFAHQDAPTPEFTDVKPGAYYAEPVKWAAVNRITLGVGDNLFAPGDACTRAQIVTFLWRAMGSPEPFVQVNPFQDVSPEDYYYKAVLWAVENGVTKGVGPSQFAPSYPCTRGEAVTFLWRAADSPNVGTSANPFQDVSPEDYYYKAVLWALKSSITNGVSADKFAPELTCTRGQIITFLYRDFRM